MANEFVTSFANDDRRVRDYKLTIWATKASFLRNKYANEICIHEPGGACAGYVSAWV